ARASRTQHPNRSREYLSSVRSTGTRGDQTLRWPASFYELGWTDSDRQRWLPDFFPGETAQDHGERRAFPKSRRWDAGFYFAGDRDGNSGRARQRHSHGAGWMSAVAVGL